jgi:outer membrane protein assembly factor BamB
MTNGKLGYTRAAGGAALLVLLIMSCSEASPRDEAVRTSRAELTSAGCGNVSGLVDSGWPMRSFCPSHQGRSPIVGAQTNTLRWTRGTFGNIDSSPVIGLDDTIYVGSDDDRLYAIQPDGTLRWSFSTGLDIESTPAVAADGTVYVGSQDNRLYAVNPDGTQRWNFLTGGDVDSSPAIAGDGTVYVGSDDNRLYAVNPNGTLQWSFLTGNDIDSSPAIGSDGTIYVGSDDNRLYAVNPNGTLKWSFLTGGNVDSSPAIASDGTIYVGSDDNRLHAVNSSGSAVWSFLTLGDVDSSPAIGADGAVYFGSDDDRLRALNPTGTLRWAFDTNLDVKSTPAIGADGTIYFGSHNNNVYALNADGTVKWSRNLGGNVDSSPAIGTNGTVYIGSDANALVAIGGTGPTRLAVGRFTPVEPATDPIQDRVRVEMRSVVIPPGANAACPDGKALVSHGGNGFTKFVSRADLPCVLDGQDDCTVVNPNELAQDPGVPPGTIPAVAPDGMGGCTPTGGQLPLYTNGFVDMSPTRLPNGGLLHLGLAVKWQVGTPASSCNATPQQQVVVFQRSTDCGATWTVLNPVEPASLLGGRYNPPVGGVSRLDRPVLYADPFSNRLYFTAATDGVDASNNVHADSLLFVSQDQGTSWQSPLIIAELSGGQRQEFQIAAPITITTTPTGRLMLFSCDLDEDVVGGLVPDDRKLGLPTLFVSDDGGQTLSDAIRIQLFDGSNLVPCGVLDHDETFQGGGVSIFLQNSYSNPFPVLAPARVRATAATQSQVDRVRLVFSELTRLSPTLKQQTLRAVGLEVPRTGPQPPTSLSIVSSRRIMPAQAGRSMIQAAFAETDRFEYAPNDFPAGAGDNNRDLAMLAWLEVPFIGDATGTVQARYAVVRDFDDWTSSATNPSFLLSEGGWTTNCDGFASPVPPPPHSGSQNLFQFCGDFNEPSFFFMGGEFNAFAVWPQSAQAAPNPFNAQVHYGVINVRP